MSNKKKKKKKTLGCFGFTKTVIHRGQAVAVSIPEVITAPPSVLCDICGQGFKNAQGLGSHKLKCEKENRKENVVAVTSNLKPAAVEDVGSEEVARSAMNYMICRVEERVQKDREKSVKEKSY